MGPGQEFDKIFTVFGVQAGRGGLLEIRMTWCDFLSSGVCSNGFQEAGGRPTLSVDGSIWHYQNGVEGLIVFLEEINVEG